ncbi:MAG: glycosyltransferase family 4 protein [Anaerolineales bacterium]|nr:glycosyltransferase family 4 protein [Anaerolineales bacterium]
MSSSLVNAKITFVHDWLIDKGGSELVLAAMLELWPKAPVYTLIQNADGPCSEFLQGHRVQTSFLQRIPGVKKHYRSWLPLFPIAIEQFDLSEFDIIISNSHAAAKGVLTGPDQLHISHVCSPIRYAWDLQHQYLREAGVRGLKSWVSRLLLHYIRLWDVRTAHGVDEFIAISHFIARRITKVYRRDSHVIYSPIDVENFPLCSEKEDFYLTVSRLVPYKRINLIVETFNAMPDKKLVVIGAGPDYRKVKALAGPNVTVLGHQPQEILEGYMQRAKAFVFAAEEDFGIVPVEAQSCGTPVIAYGKGGALETVVENKTGIFFCEQTTASLHEAVKRFESMGNCWDPVEIHKHAERFSKARFQQEILSFVEEKWALFCANQTPVEGG